METYIGARHRALLMLFLHLSSLGYGVSVFFVNFVSFSNDETIFCTLAIYSASILWCFFRASVLLLYFQRLDVLIQKKIYPPWVRVLCKCVGCLGILVILPIGVIVITPAWVKAKCNFGVFTDPEYGANT